MNDLILTQVRNAYYGSRVLIVSENPCPCDEDLFIGDGAFFMRDWGTQNWPVSIDTIVFLQEPPPQIRKLAENCTTNHGTHGMIYDLWQEKR